MRGPIVRQTPGWVALAAAAVALLLPASAAGAAYAPLDRPGPELEVPRADLKASLVCSDGVKDATRTPVLLLPATGVDSDHNFSWNYERAFRQEGIPYCTSDQQGQLRSNMDDIQTRGEYVTYAIRTMYRAAGRKITTLGHSQGGMIARWSLRFWPDTREMVEDLIGMAPSNHGSAGGGAACATGCSPAFAQQAADSNFIAALNSRQESFPGISYTQIFTRNDEVVTPPASAGIGGPGEITNVAIQEVCPTDVEEHLAVGTSDATAYALVLDAIGRAGPADPEAIGPGVCAQQFMPGINPATYAADSGRSFAYLANSVLTYPQVSEEPPLRCYVTLAGCGGARDACAGAERGTNRSDVFFGTKGSDGYRGRGDGDLIEGRGGDDCLGGGRGADELKGAAGEDLLTGGRGFDDLHGGSRADRIGGGRGSDTMRGGGGSDLIDGAEGRDALRGGGGGDRITAGAGQDQIRGGEGSDTIRAADGERDLVICGKGRDTVRVDRIDQVRPSCERVRRARAAARAAER